MDLLQPVSLLLLIIYGVNHYQYLHIASTAKCSLLGSRYPPFYLVPFYPANVAIHGHNIFGVAVDGWGCEKIFGIAV